MVVDFSYSIHLATKLKEFKEYRDLRFEEFKKEKERKLERLKERLDNGYKLDEEKEKKQWNYNFQYV